MLKAFEEDSNECTSKIKRRTGDEGRDASYEVFLETSVPFAFWTIGSDRKARYERGSQRNGRSRKEWQERSNRWGSLRLRISLQGRKTGMRRQNCPLKAFAVRSRYDRLCDFPRDTQINSSLCRAQNEMKLQHSLRECKIPLTWVAT